MSLQTLLESRAYPRTTHQKATGEYRIDCPYCIDRVNKKDEDGKLYLNPKKNLAHCFRCGYSTNSLYKLLQALFGEDILATEYLDLQGSLPKEAVFVPKLDAIKTIDYPMFTCSLASTGVPEIDLQVVRAIDYLKRRGLSEVEWIKYKFRYCYAGVYQDRVIVPIFLNGELVDWFGRIILSKEEFTKKYGEQKKYFRFLYAPHVPTDKIFFNQDSCLVNDEVIITEGIFDALAVLRAMPTSQVIASFTKRLSFEQREFINQFSKKIICWDKDALKESTEEAKRHKNMFIMCVPAKDPGEATKEQIISAYKLIARPNDINLVYSLMR